MTRILSVLFATSCFPALVLPQEPPAVEVPRLEFAALAHDFGALTAGSDVAHDFTFRVQGEGALTIRRLHVSCGCTVPALVVEGESYTPGTPIASGRTGRLRVKLKTLDGEARRSSAITLYTDQPPYKVELSVTGYVEPFYDLSPAYANFEEVLQGRVESRELVVGVRGDRQLELGEWGVGRALRPVPTDDKGMPTITEEEIDRREHEDAYGLDPRPEHLLVKVERTESGSHRIEVHLQASHPEGPFLYALRFRTNVGPPLNFRVQGVVQPRVGTDPASLLAFGLLRRGRSVEKVAKVLDRDPEREVRVLGVDLVDCPVAEHLTVAWEAAADDAIAHVRVTVRETLPGGAFEGVLRIRTDHPAHPVRELKLSGFAR